ncbi:MAG: hypothetical protein DRR06_16520, partial [Gammaproteobacteria bacterium]
WNLLKQAQKYSVNVFPNVWEKLKQADAIFPIQGEEIYYLHERFYSDNFGLATEDVSNMDLQLV